MSGKRPDGDGLVRKRADGRWEGRIVIGHKEDGTPIFKSVFARTQKELMPKLHSAIDCYRGADLSEEGNMTVAEWVNQQAFLREGRGRAPLRLHHGHLRHHAGPAGCDGGLRR
ncbi:MAG: site-specific integrase, partial [Oscillospiraceae bacterium]|nr:site-specific integrase [Oscillospiraceae bacterium]